MSRSFLLFAGAFCWTVAGVDALVHLVNGDVVIPALMATAAVLWVALRQRALIYRRVLAMSAAAGDVEVEVDSAA